MQTALDLLNTLLPLLYALAMVNYIVYLVRDDPFSARTCTPFLVAVFGLHCVYFLLGSLHHASSPIATMPEVLSAVALSVAGVYLYVERVQGSKVTGPFQLPMVVVMQLIASTLMHQATHPSPSASAGFSLHAFAAVLAHSAFVVGAVYAIMYVVMYRALKAKRFGVVFQRLPPLDKLAGMGFGATALGWVLLTASIIVGFVITKDVSESAYRNPYVIGALGIWLIYGVALLSYFGLGLKGARTVYLSLLAFAFAVAAISGAAIWPVLHRFQT
ncbi:MAG: inner membrane protein YpjD [Myxococcota bacterium]